MNSRTTSLDAVLDGHRRHVSDGMGRMLRMLGAPIEASSLGCHVFDEHGERYLSCGGNGVFLLGHGHPRILNAVLDQLRKRSLATHLLADPTIVEAAVTLAEYAPAGLDHVTFTNSGAEAVEVALKLARVSGRRRIIAMDNGFHGKTLGALSVTGRDRYRSTLGPLLPGVVHVPFGDLPAVRWLLADGEPTAVIVEPVQAEGGVRIPPPDYLAGLRRACDEADALLIVDEIQTGLGRLGTPWGCSEAGVTPDILLAGKILGGGVVPVGATIASAEAHSPLDRDPFLHTSTFGGNPVAATAAMAALSVLRDEDLANRSGELGARLLPAIRAAMFAGCPGAVREVRGRGLLIGIEFDSARTALAMTRALLRRRVIVSHTLGANEVVRLTPPAILGEADIEWLLTALGGAAEEIGGRG
ncbi:aspartate aminotransferase family protein [Nocardia sp. NPDC003482]